MSAESTTIRDGTVVGIHYVLKNDKGETLDSSQGQAPLEYLHGFGQIVPGLEQALTGHAAGERFDVTVEPDEGYGERDPRGEQRVPLSAFPRGMQLEPGTPFHTEGPDGETMVVWVIGVEGDRVTVDLNHPLAGVTLHFDVSVESVRVATAEELEHKHAHGPDGHHHHDDDHDHGHGHGHGH